MELSLIITYTDISDRFEWHQYMPHGNTMVHTLVRRLSQTAILDGNSTDTISQGCVRCSGYARVCELWVMCLMRGEVKSGPHSVRAHWSRPAGAKPCQSPDRPFRRESRGRAVRMGWRNGGRARWSASRPAAGWPMARPGLVPEAEETPIGMMAAHQARWLQVSVKMPGIQ